MRGCKFRNILSINVPKSHGVLFEKKFSKLSEFYYLEPGFYLSIVDLVGAMDTLNQEKHNHSERRITVKACRRTQKLEIYLANEGSGLAFFSTDLRHIFRSNVGNELGVMLKGKGPHKPEFVTTLSAYLLS